MDEKLQSLISIASLYVGTHEEGGDNRGSQVEEFQKVAGGHAGQAWCMDFVQFCIEQVAEKFKSPSVLWKSQLVMDVWNKTPAMCRLSQPLAGAIMIWEMFDENGQALPVGHCGIVTDALADQWVKTIEGNTGPGSSDPNQDRNGDGVYQRVRHIVGTNRMRVKGWLLPWV